MKTSTIRIGNSLMTLNLNGTLQMEHAERYERDGCRGGRERIVMGVIFTPEQTKQLAEWLNQKEN